MKSSVKYILHKLFGFKNYLFVFSLFKIYTLKRDKNEKDFFSLFEPNTRNTIVLDIGANIGIMSVHLARSIKHVKVICFEPMPNNIIALKRIVDYFKLDNITIFECALGNTEGTVEMVMPIVDSVRMQGLSHVKHVSISENNEGESVNVPIKILDKIEALTQLQKRISAIKIDVENFEYFVLDGAKSILKQNKPIVYAELWENENREKCFELFKGLNYNTFVISQNKMVVFDRARHKTQNFIFLPA